VKEKNLGTQGKNQSFGPVANRQVVLEKEVTSLQVFGGWKPGGLVGVV